MPGFGGDALDIITVITFGRKKTTAIHETTRCHCVLAQWYQFEITRSATSALRVGLVKWIGGLMPAKHNLRYALCDVFGMVYKYSMLAKPSYPQQSTKQLRYMQTGYDSRANEQTR